MTRRIPIPSGYGPTDRASIGQDVIDFIRTRTISGRDKSNSTFADYSPAYAAQAHKGNPPDLYVTGNMLGSLQLISSAIGVLVIGYEPGLQNSKAEGHITGQLGLHSGPVRDFLGLTQDDLDDILANYPLAAGASGRAPLSLLPQPARTAAEVKNFTKAEALSALTQSLSTAQLEALGIDSQEEINSLTNVQLKALLAFYFGLGSLVPSGVAKDKSQDE